MKTLIVSFHIGRGGKFYNSGHKTFLGELNFQDIINRNSNDLFYNDRNKQGQFCKPYYSGCSGNIITKDINSEIGTLEFDGQYNTSYSSYIEDCSEFELQLIAETHFYKSPELVNFLTDQNPELKFDEYGILIESKN